MPLLLTMGRLAVLGGLGFLVFRPMVSQERAYPPFVSLVLNVMLPIYFVHRIPAGWESTSGLGPGFLGFFFVLCLVMIALQTWIGAALARRPGAEVSMPTQFVVLFALQNAGFLPLPILERLVSDSIMIATFFYLFAFNLVFWSIALPIIKDGRFSFRSFRFRLSPSLVGMAVGFLIAVTGTDRFIPDVADRIMGRIADVALDAILVALGGALAGIRERVRIQREHLVFVSAKLLVYPAVMIAIAALPWPGFGDPEFAWGMRAFLVLQAAVPPATQTLVLTKSIAGEEATHYTGRMILLTYLAALATIPLFMAITILLYST